MDTKCIELEFPHDGRRKATIITNDKTICEYLALNPDAKLSISIIAEGMDLFLKKAINSVK